MSSNLIEGRYVDLPLPPALVKMLHALAAESGVDPDALIANALTWYVRRPTSRARSEGRYVGHAEGKAVRHFGVIRRVRSAKARAVLRRRVYKANGLPIPAWAVE